MKRSWLLALALGGAAVSLSTPQQEHNLLRLPSFRGLAEVRASLPGRMRLYMPAIAQHWQQAEQMRWAGAASSTSRPVMSVTVKEVPSATAEVRVSAMHRQSARERSLRNMRIPPLR